MTVPNTRARLRRAVGGGPGGNSCKSPYLSETQQPTQMRPGMTIHFIASPKDEHSKMNMTDGWPEHKLQRKKIFAAFAFSSWRIGQVIGGFTTPRFHQHFCSFRQPFIGTPSPSSYWIKDSKRWKNWCVGAFSIKRYKILPPKNNKIFFSIVLRRSYRCLMRHQCDPKSVTLRHHFLRKFWGLILLLNIIS